MALMRRIGFTRFSRWGDNLGRLTVYEATHKEALDGTDELTLTCAEELAKGDRIVWFDRQGACHEHIVDEPAHTHDDSGAPRTTATCIGSIAELWDDYVVDKRPSGSEAVALASILDGTRWSAGTCDLHATASHTFYHISVREAVAELLDTWGGELEVTYAADGSGITKRSVGIRKLRGNQQSPKRFTWTKDLLSIKRTVASENPKTRIYCYGKGVETESGGFGRRLTIGDVNNGLDYVEDAEATKVWGHPDGKGGILPATGTYVNEQCEDAKTLLAEGKAYLEDVKEPKVTYDAEVLDLVPFGRAWEGVALGDSTAIIDKGFTERGIRLKGRVSQVERDLMDAEGTKVSFGNIQDAMTDMWAAVSQALKGQSSKSAAYDAVAGRSPGWLQQLQSSLNEQFQATGTYKVETFEIGTIYSNVPLDPVTGLPVKQASNMWAMNLNGRGFRLATGLTAQGEWNWRSFGTGEGFTADEINAGTMRADRVRAGLLTDEVGKNFWDLTSGEFSLSSSTTVGGESLGDRFDGVSGDLGKLDQSIKDANDAIADINKDGIVTKAEAAAIDKMQQVIDLAKAEDTKVATSAVELAKGTAGTSIGGVTSTYYQLYEASSAEYKLLSAAISAVKAAKTSAALDTAIATYKQRFAAYQVQRSSFLDALQSFQSSLAKILAEAARDKALTEAKADAAAKAEQAYQDALKADGDVQKAADAKAKAYVDALDESLGQRSVFDRLTNNGATQGIYLKDGKVYINGTYVQTGVLDGSLIKAGIITDKAGKNYWDMTTGEFSLSANASVGGTDIGGAVTSADVEYGLSASASVQPTSWTTTAMWAQGKHLWTRVKMTLADGTVKYSPAKRIANDKGLGVAVVTEQYYLSTSPSLPAGGSWADKQQSWVKGRVYFTRSKVTWSDGSITYTDPVAAWALTNANQSTNNLDDKLTQTEVFNRLTNNGATQGIYMSGGKLYINATYMKTGIITDGIGRNTWNLSTGALTTNYMTANNVTASGTFKCGSTYGIELNSIGQMAGYRSGSKVGYIDYSSSSYDVSNPSTKYYGLQMQAQGIVRLSTPRFSTASTSDTSVTTTSGATGSFTQRVAYDLSITAHSDGSISWSYKNGSFSISTINGLVTSRSWNT